MRFVIAAALLTLASCDKAPDTESVATSNDTAAAVNKAVADTNAARSDMNIPVAPAS